MKTLHYLIAGLRPTLSNSANRVAIPSLIVGASLALVQPCAGLSFEFEETGSMATARAFHTATLLPDGKVLVAGSNDFSSIELYDPASGTWATTGSMIDGRAGHTATLLATGKVLVACGVNSSFGLLATAELYDPMTGTWSATGSLATARDVHTATLLADGKVLVAGGFGDNGVLRSA